MFLAFVFITAAYAANDLPSYIRICGRNSSNDVYGQCIADNINNVKNTICSQGLPEFNVPPVEPMIIDKIVVYDRDSFKLISTDAKIRGLCDFEITSHNVSSDKLRFEIDFKFKRLTVDAKYDFDIQILVSLAHKGLIHVTGDDTGLKWEVQLKEVTKNGKTEIYASKVKTKLIITKKIGFELNDKEEGLSQLHEIISKTLNDNYEEIINTLKPSIEAKASKIIMSILNKITYNNFEQMFPDEA
ncbi:uncharacterized protein LOC105203821 [Solenopsis invicta]|uniref:uncharacterized protein LOC105203821 n=1 Tax=Solenopsis invicta TaxID=13686 RepID=UPI000595A346|nr:uncharacterized protein LOC105203821 [Solenopsis invicta]